MRFGLWALLALLLGAFLAHFVMADRGYVLVNFRGYVVEMSVPGLLLVLIGLYLAVRGVAALVRTPISLRKAVRQSRARRGAENVARGLTHLAEGDWARSERLLTSGLSGSEAPVVNYLLAARAAHEQGAGQRRDEWLKLAHDASPDARAAALLTQAELQLDARELDAALATLERLQAVRPDHPGALGLLAQVRRARNEPQEIVALLPRLARARLSSAEREALAAEALGAELGLESLTSERLDEVWSQLSAELRAAPPLLARRAVALGRLGRGADAERELRAALKKSWQRELVLAYGEIRADDVAKQLQHAESWLKTYPEDPALLLTAGRLCMSCELWGKARSYLESSLAIAPVPDAYAVYGRLLTELGESDRASLAFRAGLALASPSAAVDLEVPPPPPRELGPPPAPGAAPDEVRRDVAGAPGGA
jgi:HemY protein